jgi:23S rRNA pseudouridine2605 synthase
MAQERLQKNLARAGEASRRAAEALIAQGKVRINCRIITELGARADALNDRVEVDGQRLVTEKPAYYVLNKPREVVTTLKDPEGRPTIADLLRGVPERVFPIGRLDFHTSGVLLLTNDGELSQALLHPTRGVPKTYVAKVRGHLSVPKLQMLRDGVVLDDGTRTGHAELFVIREEKATTWLQITITEGKNRQIHRMCEAIGHRVMRLSRIEFAGISVEGIRPGDYRPVTVRELAKLDRDYRNPASRQRENVARVQRHAESGFALDGDERAIVRAQRGMRRSGHKPEPRGARRDKPVVPPPEPTPAEVMREALREERRDAMRPGFRAGVKRTAKPTPKRTPTPKGRRVLPARDTREARDTRDTRDTRGARPKPPARDTRETHDTRAVRSKPPARGTRDARFARGKPPARDALDAPRKPPFPARDERDSRRKPPAPPWAKGPSDPRRKPPAHDAQDPRGKPPVRDRNERPRKPPARIQTRRKNG